MVDIRGAVKDDSEAARWRGATDVWWGEKNFVQRRGGGTSKHMKGSRDGVG